MTTSCFESYLRCCDNMATSDDAREVFHRRVQSRIAGEFLKHIDPDALTDPYRYQGDNTERLARLSDHVDKKTQEKFEEKFSKYRKKDSPFSIANVIWLMAGIAAVYFSDIFMVLRYDPRVNMLWLGIGSVMICINIVIAIFLVVYLSFIKKLNTDDWDRQYPALIPIATAAFIVGAICVTVGLWPVWGFLTIPILFSIFMSTIVLVAMFG